MCQNLCIIIDLLDAEIFISAFFAVLSINLPCVKVSLA